MMFCEKYRPKQFSDVVGIDERIKSISKKDMQHYLFVGSAGTGKTTTAKIIINKFEAESLELNASAERGIDVIRDKVTTFAMSKSMNNKLKIVFLDEADAITFEGQTALRNTMEKYSDTCKFILTGNYGNKFIDAIKSRCSVIEFKQPEKKDIEKRLSFIISEEKIKIQEEALKELINKFYPDIRAMINKLQQYQLMNKEITKEEIKKENLMIADIFALLKDKKFMEARQLLLDNEISYEQLIEETESYVMNGELNINKKLKILLLLCEVNKHLKSCIKQELLYAEFMAKTIMVLKEE